MSLLTSFFNLIKAQKTDVVKASDYNANLDTIDAEMHKPPLTVNGVQPDPVTRNAYVEQVPLADNLASDIAQINNGSFAVRTSGGGTPVESGAASLVYIKGNMIKTGYVPEVLNMTVTPAPRDEGDPITATIDRDTFVSYVSTSGTITLTYTTGWSASPANYGITVDGTPIYGDAISVEYVKEDRGTLTPATPTSFNATGWNLYDNETGIARVVAYSTEYGYRIGGTYSLVEFSATLTGSRTTVTPEDGLFNVTEDGYIFVAGGTSTTYIFPTWSDWTGEPEGHIDAYTLSTINLTEAMLTFPNGLLAVGDVRDEINLNVQKVIQRIERLAYTEENLENVIDSGVAYDTDTNYIYAALETPVSTDIAISGNYTVNDHGIEFFDGTTVPVLTEILYGENLKDKLRTDVVTISEQTLTAEQKAQVRENIGVIYANNLVTTNAGYALDARQGKTLDDKIKRESTIRSLVVKTAASSTASTVNTYDSRKFSDYYLLCFILRDNSTSNNIRDAVTIPSDLWTTGQQVYLVQSHGVSLENTSGITVAYNNDTSVRVVTLGAGALTGFEILGFMRPN